MRSKPRKLIIAFNNLNIGGIETKIVDICCHYSQKNDVSVYLLLKEKSGPLLCLLPPQIKILSSKFPNIFKIKTILFPLFLSTNFKKINPDTIISFGNYSSICTLIGAFFSHHQNRVIISEDSSIDLQLASDKFTLLRKTLIRILYPRARKIIVLSDVGKKKLLSLVPRLKSIIVRYNWVSLSFTRKLQQRSVSRNIDILFIGRFEEQKNPLRFIKIVKIVSQKKPNIRCLMVGSGTLHQQVTNLIKSSQLEKNISVLPSSTDVTNYYLSSKLFLFTSRHEGFPLTLLESCAAGCLPIMKKIPEINNYFHEYSSSLMFNNDNEAVKKILSILNKPTKLKEIVNHYQKLVLSQQKDSFKSMLHEFK